MDLCEQDLKTLLAANCGDYFYLLVKAYQHRLYGYVLCLLCHNFHDAEDVLQDTFAKAFKALLGYTWLQIEELELEAWLFTIARNLALNYRNRVGKRQSQLISIDLLKEYGVIVKGECDRYSSDPEIAMERKESSEELYACIEQLPKVHQEPVILHYIEGLPYHKIATILDQPLNTVKSNGYRGFKKLQELIKEQRYAKEEVK